MSFSLKFKTEMDAMLALSRLIKSGGASVQYGEEDTRDRNVTFMCESGWESATSTRDDFLEMSDSSGGTLDFDQDPIFAVRSIK